MRKVLEKHATPERLNALYDGTDEVSGPLWSAFAELGLPGLLVPESLGGAGASAREAAAVLEELGRAAAPSPFLSSSVVATTALVALGDTTILPLLASGEQTAALLVRPTALHHGPAALTTVGRARGRAAAARGRRAVRRPRRDDHARSPRST